jgi:hypothetical protein
LAVLRRWSFEEGGLAIAQIVAHVGDAVIVIDERTLIKPDLAGAEALMLKQYKRLAGT